MVVPACLGTNKHHHNTTTTCLGTNKQYGATRKRRCICSDKESGVPVVAAASPAAPLPPSPLPPHHPLPAQHSPSGPQDQVSPLPTRAYAMPGTDLARAAYALRRIRA
eukprot:1641062-Rhodomonas_salina.1